MKTAASKARIHFDNILYATDFSPTAQSAIPFVKKIARQFNSNILAFHVKPQLINPMTTTEPATWPALIEAAKVIDKEQRVKLLEEFKEFHADVEIDEGDLRFNLENAIRTHSTDLIIIGTHGRTGVAKIFLGSVAEEIFRTVSCPVLTVGPHCDPAKSNVRKVLFATDFASEAPIVAAYAVYISQEFRAELTMMHVVPEPKPGQFEMWSEVQESTKNRLRHLVPAEAEALCKPDYFVERGEPADRILDLASLRDIDLIVLGARSEEGVPGAATHLGIATAHRVVARANCPVLTVSTENLKQAR